MHRTQTAVIILLSVCLTGANAAVVGNAAAEGLPDREAAGRPAFAAFLNADPGQAENGSTLQSPESGDGYFDSCGSTCCDSSSACNLCPRSYIWAEGLILTRDNQSVNRPLAEDLNTGDVLLTAGDLDFDWSGGFRLGYGQQLCDCWAVELGYLGYYDQSASAGARDEDTLRLPGDLGLQVNNFFAADDIDMRYTSDLHSAEINMVRSCRECADYGLQSLEWLAGFRYLNLDERFSISAFDSAESTTNYTVRTENHLYGAQLGARARRCVGSWSWEATGKAGVYGNDMQQRQGPIIDFPNFEFRPARGSGDSDVAFVGDLNLSGIYQLTQAWGLRAGYNLIWIEGVALAPDQLDFSNFSGSGRGLASGGGVLLHGVNVGVESRW